MLSVYNFQPDAHYPIVCSWWQKHNSTILDINDLPETGLICFRDNVPMAATWYYLPNAEMAQIGWTVTNPDLGPIERIKACAFVLEEAEDCLRKIGFKRVISFSDNSALTKLMKKEGYKALQPHEFLIKDLNGYECLDDPLL